MVSGGGKWSREGGNGLRWGEMVLGGGNGLGRGEMLKGFRLKVKGNRSGRYQVSGLVVRPTPPSSRHIGPLQISAGLLAAAAAAAAARSAATGPGRLPVLPCDMPLAPEPAPAAALVPAAAGIRGGAGVGLGGRVRAAPVIEGPAGAVGAARRRLGKGREEEPLTLQTTTYPSAACTGQLTIKPALAVRIIECPADRGGLCVTVDDALLRFNNKNNKQQPTRYISR